MTLEDFFTLSEMKDGLSTINRVEELFSVMLNQKVVGDAARQWTTVANIIAITENKDCLDRFMQLNGLSFLNNWLHEVQKCSDDNGDCSREELINAVLRALDRLPVDIEKSSSSGVGITVKKLYGHMSHSIQDKARALHGKWKHVEDNNSKCQTVDKNGLSSDDESNSKPSLEITGAEGLQSNTVHETSPSDKVSDENAKICSNSSPADTSEVEKFSSNQISSSSTSSERNEVLGEMNMVASSLVLNPCEESLLLKEEPVYPAAGVASTGTCGSPLPRGRTVDEPSDASNRNASDDPEDMDIEVNMKEVGPCNEKERCFTAAEVSFHKKDDSGMVSESKEDKNDSNLKVDKSAESKISSALKSPVDAYTINEIEKRSSELGFEYGEIDALEVARQVAIEVEREVVDYREPFCSSPEEISRGEIDSCSSDLAENENDKPVVGQLRENDSPSQKDLSIGSSPKNSTRTSEDVDNKGSLHDPGSPKSTSVLQSIGNTEKNKCGFDLNEYVCSDENDSHMATANQTINLSVPIHVAASKGSPCLPVTPLQFEGELGWRGSAATSAFRPASPRRTDGEKALCGPKQKTNFLKFDLNVAECEDDVVVDDLLSKHNSLLSSVPSDKSSVETSSRRADRLKLDLNRIGDEDTLPNHLSHWRPPHPNGNCSPSPASSSSSRQPSMRDFDLNDNPLFDSCGGPNSAGKSLFSKETSAYGSYNFDDSAITIMGSRMSVERKEPVNQARRSFLGNGLGVDSAMRSSVPYPPMLPHAYSYHGLQMGSTMPIPPALYGPGSIPYMVDTRGATVIPQILGSAGLGGATASRPHFLMSVAGAPSGLNMIGSVSRPSLDLNSGTLQAEGVSREMGSFQQLFMQGNGGLVVEDHMTTTASQPAGPGVVRKRKEPDCGWEPYPFDCKQATWQ